MTLKELKAKAASLNIAGRSKMNKAELEKAITVAESQNTEHTVESFGLFLGTLTKSEARKERKKMRAAGRTDLSAARRIVGQTNAVRKAA